MPIFEGGESSASSLYFKETRLLHVNAALTPRHRLIAARLLTGVGWPASEVAPLFQLSCRR